MVVATRCGGSFQVVRLPFRCAGQVRHFNGLRCQHQLQGWRHNRSAGHNLSCPHWRIFFGMYVRLFCHSLAPTPIFIEANRACWRMPRVDVNPTKDHADRSLMWCLNLFYCTQLFIMRLKSVDLISRHSYLHVLSVCCALRVCQSRCFGVFGPALYTF